MHGLSKPQFCGDFAELLHSFAVRMPALDFDRIFAYALELDAATVKRLGWVLEHLGVDLSALDRLLDFPIKGYRKLDPGGPTSGPANRRWNVWENLPGRVPTGDAMEQAVREAYEFAAALLDEYAPVEVVSERYTENEPHPGGRESIITRAHNRITVRCCIQIPLFTAMPAGDVPPRTSVRFANTVFASGNTDRLTGARLE